ncbi:unnamed protein product [Withania somnifera]
MGACATKPKDLQGEAPEAAPENVPAEEIVAKDAAEIASKDVVVVAEEEVKKEIEGLADEDDAARRRSLSNLFKENEEGKGSEQVKEEGSQITLASGPSEAKPEEVEKAVDVPVTSEIEKAPEVASITPEAPKAVETSEEKKVEEVKSEIKTPADKEVDEVKPAVETPAEKKIEEAPAATDARISGAPMEMKAEENTAASEVTVIEEKKSEQVLIG